ncbi:MAG: hemerythrin domain-containing protein, partial [bacterium]|nr:hemerythrin domain-containing protein [bacterium]
LIENVEHHVEEEENEMFPLVEDELSEEALVELAERVQKEKAKAGGGKNPVGLSSKGKKKS